jgi:hypothetical protein
MSFDLSGSLDQGKIRILITGQIIGKNGITKENR